EVAVRSPGRHRLGDTLFRGLSTGSALLILLVLAGVGTFLVVEALPVASAAAEDVTGGTGFLPYIWPLVLGTLVASAVAMVVATPVAVGIALFVSHYAERRVGTGGGFVDDLVAAVARGVYGVWGLGGVAPALAS